MIGRKAEAVLNLAVRYAVDRDHEYFTLEHVLWALLGEDLVVETLRACGGDLDELKQDLEKFLDSEIPKAQPEPPVSGSGEGTSHPVATLSIQRLIQRALFQVQSAGKDEIQPIDLLVALFQAKESYALQLLTAQGIERLDVLQYVSHGLRADAGRDSHDSEDEIPSEEGTDGEEARRDPKKKSGSGGESPLEQ